MLSYNLMHVDTGINIHGATAQVKIQTFLTDFLPLHLFHPSFTSSPTATISLPYLFTWTLSILQTGTLRLTKWVKATQLVEQGGQDVWGFQAENVLA